MSSRDVRLSGLWNVGYGNESPFIGVPGDY